MDIIIKILDRLRFSPPPRDPGPTAPQAKKNAILVLQSAFSNDLCAVMWVTFGERLGSILRFSGFEILDLEIFGWSFSS